MQKLISLVVISTTIRHTISTLNFLQNIAIQSTTQSFFAIKAQSTHIVALSSVQQMNRPPTLHYKLTNTSNNTLPIYLPSFGSISANPSQLPSLRLSKSNPQCIIIYNSTNLTVFQNLSYSYSVANINSVYNPYKIKSSCFGKNQTQQYIVLELANGTYLLLRYVNNICIQTLTLAYTSSISKLDQILTYRQFLFITFETQIFIYFTNTTILTQINPWIYGWIWTYSSTPIQNISMDAGGDLLCVSHGKEVHVIQLIGVYYTRLSYFHEQIYDVSVQQFYPYYYFVVTSLKLYQVDYYETDLVIGQIYRETSKPLKINCISSNKLIIYEDMGSANSINKYSKIIQIYQYQFKYITSNPNCRAQYVRIAGTFQCQKILPTPTITPSNQTNSTPIINPVNTTTTINNSEQIPVDVDKQLQQYFIQLEDNQNFGTLASATGVSLAFSSLRIAPKSLLCLILFFDDLQFYRYHRKKNPQYPQSVQFFMNKVSMVNYIRLDPFVRKTFAFFNTSFIGQQKQQIYNQYLHISETDPNSFYFLNNSENIYKNCFIFNIISFLICKILHLLLHFLKSKAQIFEKLLLAVSQYTQWWTLIIAMIQMNVAFITFNCSLQLFLPSYFNLFDKCNFIISLVFFYSVLLYLICMYSLIGNDKSNKSGKVLLVNFRYKIQSFYLQPLLILIRCFLRSFIQGYILFDYKTQITLLTLIDFPFIILCYRARAYFQNLWVYIFCFLYLNFLFIFDLFFCIQGYNQPFMSQIAKRELFGMIIICLLGLSRLFVSMNFLLISLYQIMKLVMGCCQGNIFVNQEKEDYIVSQIKNNSMRNAKNQKQIFQQQQIMENTQASKMKVTQLMDQKQKTCQTSQNGKIFSRTGGITSNKNRILPSGSSKQQKTPPLFFKLEQLDN